MLKKNFLYKIEEWRIVYGLYFEIINEFFETRYNDVLKKNFFWVVIRICFLVGRDLILNKNIVVLSMILNIKRILVEFDG